MCFYSYRSSVTHGFLNGSQQSLWIFFALKAVFYCLSQTVRHHSLMSSQKQIKNKSKIHNNSETGQTSLTDLSTRRNKGKELSGRLFFSNYWPCTNTVSGLSELHPKPPNSKLAWEQRNPEKEESGFKVTSLKVFVSVFPDPGTFTQRYR